MSLLRGSVAFSLALLNHNNGPLAYINGLCLYASSQNRCTDGHIHTYTVFIYLSIYLFTYLFIYLFTQYYKRVTHLAKIAFLPCGPLLT